MKAVSLFSSAGIGEVYLKDIDIEVVVASELLEKRAKLYRFLNPDSHMIVGDIREMNIKNEIEGFITKDVKLLICTPPCQGVSSLGKNKNQEDFQVDHRNFLVYDIFYFIDKYDFEYILIENVSKYLKMFFPYKNGFLKIEDLVREKYSSDYNIEVLDINAKDYGVPQSRPRCFIKLSKKGKIWRNPEVLKEITLEKAIGHLPSLESGEDSGIKWHKAKKHNDREILTMKYTPPGSSALKNPEHYPKKEDGTRIKGFHNTYKRLRWDLPCHARTTYSGNISSHNNVHPGRKHSDSTYSDARVLTLLELFIVSSLPENWDLPGWATDTFIRQVIGESVPPKLMKKILEGIE